MAFLPCFSKADVSFRNWSHYSERVYFLSPFVFSTKQCGSDMTVFKMKKAPVSAFMKEAAVCSCHYIYTQPKELTTARLQTRCLHWCCFNLEATLIFLGMVKTAKCHICICSLSGQSHQEKVTVALPSFLFYSRLSYLYLW